MRILSILFFFASLNAFGATCTTTTRTNYTTGQTLTSTALNADFNQLVTKANAFDGGCVTDGTLEASALNSTDFAAVTNGIHQGCALAYSDANTISVGKCILGVNGNFVKTTTANTVTWGCTGCDAEASSSLYYVYAKTGSSGTTLNLLISSTAPGVDGYDLSSNKVLGLFVNGPTLDITESSIESWVGNSFKSKIVEHFTFNYSDGAGGACTAATCTVSQNGYRVISVTKASAGNYTANFRKTYRQIICSGNTFGSALYHTGQFTKSGTVTNMAILSSSGGVATDSQGSLTCSAME